VNLTAAFFRDDGIHHFNIFIPLLFFVSFFDFFHVLQVEFGERCPYQRY
jgi:hypothetical protein